MDPAVKAAVQSLKPHLVACKKRWESEVKVKTGKSKELPFPITVKRLIPTPESCEEWDVDDLAIVLCVDGPASGGAKGSGGGVTAAGFGWHVEVPQKSLPVAVAAKIAEVVETMWGKELSEHATAGEAGVQDWRLEPMFTWAEQKYSMLLGMVPACIDVYEGCNAAGATCRRYTLVDAETDDDGADDGAAAAPAAAAAAAAAAAVAELDPKEQARRDAIVAKKRREREDAALAKARDKEADALQKRAMAECGLAEFKHVQLSKKEQEERSKSKQGVRTAKTGARRKAYDGPGSKIAREEEEKKKGTKQKKK